MTRMGGKREKDQTLYAYCDGDVDTLGRALGNRDGYAYFKTGNPDLTIDDATRQETGIAFVNGGTVVELPAISSTTTSPPGPRIEEQITHLETLMGESPHRKNLKGFPVNPNQIYPLKILAPYKLAGSWHWNVLEITIEEPGGVANCKRYDTDGYSSAVEPSVFNNISQSLSKNRDNGAPFCSQIINSQDQIGEYPHSLQKGVNCGLVSAIILNDLRQGHDTHLGYDNGQIPANISDQDLRNLAIQSVNDHETNATTKQNFCKEIDRSNFVNNQRSLERFNPDVATRQIIKSEISTIPLNEDQIRILKECQDFLKNSNESLAITALKDNQTSLPLELIRAIFSNPDDNSSRRVKEHALDALKESLLSKDVDPEKDPPSPLKTNDNISLAISTLKNYLAFCNDSDLSDKKELNSLIDALTQSLDSTSIDAFKFLAEEAISKHLESLDEARKLDSDQSILDQPSTDSPTDNTDTPTEQPVDNTDTPTEQPTNNTETPSEEPKTLPPKLTPVEKDIIKNFPSSEPDPGILELSQKVFDSASPLNPSNKEKTSKQKSYCGIGASVTGSHNTKQGRYDFTVTNIVSGGIAEQMGLKAGHIISVASGANSPDSFKKAIDTVRRLALLRLKNPGLSAQELSILKDTVFFSDPNNNTIFKDPINDPSIKSKTLIHEGRSYDNPKDFINAVKEKPPAMSPPSTSPKKVTAEQALPITTEQALNG